jgi:hypothetical protein
MQSQVTLSKSQSVGKLGVFLLCQSRITPSARPRRVLTTDATSFGCLFKRKKNLNANMYRVANEELRTKGSVTIREVVCTRLRRSGLDLDGRADGAVADVGPDDLAAGGC